MGELKQYLISYSAAGGSYPTYYDIIENYSLNEAEDIARMYAVDEYESFEGRGLPDLDEIMEEDEELDYDEAVDMYEDYVENTIEYYAEEYDEEKHSELLY